MPSRKSDVRRSDVDAVARVAHADDDSEMATPQQDTPAPQSGASVAGALSSETPSAAAPESTAAPSEKGKEKEKSKERDTDAITIEDLNLPKSIITRLAKGVLPPNTQIQANAILGLSKSATVFISHLANAANELTQMSGKKTIMPHDVFRALDDIEYGFMRERLEAEFAKFNETQSTKRSAYRKKVSAAKKAVTGGGDTATGADESMFSTGTGVGGEEASFLANTTVGTETGGGDGDDDGDGGGGGGRAAKKAKVDPSAAASAGGESSRMEVDGEDKDGEVSDAETVPDEEVDEDDDDDDDDDEEEDEDEEDESDEEGNDAGRRPGGEDDELEERPDRQLADEALDDDSD